MVIHTSPYQLTAPRPMLQQHEDHSTESVSLLLPFVSSGREAHMMKPLANYTTLPPYSVSSSLEKEHPRFIGGSFIDKLPFEVRLRIANELSQYDALHLMCVDKAFFESTVVRLYHRVIVDHSYSYFNQDVLAECFSRSNASYIKTKYSLKTFLKSVSLLTPVRVSDFGKEHVSYSIFINKLQFGELPDGFYTPFDLNFFAFMSIKKLARLNQFYWGSEKELSLEVINRLPNKTHLNSLHVNVDFKRLQSLSDFDAFKGFNNLEKLSVEQFLNSVNLFNMFKALLEDKESVSKLKVLRLARMNSSRGFIKNPSTAMLVLTPDLLANEPMKVSEYDMKCILNLFILFRNTSGRMDGLRSVCIDSIVVSSADATRLNTIMNLNKLEHVELRNITEVQIPEDVNIPLTMNELCTRLDPGFLKFFGDQLMNVTKLRIDYRESLRDTVPSFIRKLNNLVELDVTIRWNVTKLCSTPSWRHLCKNYVSAILSHAGTLKKLSLETKEDSIFCDLHKLIHTECLMTLSGLIRLESLRLHGYSLQPCAALLSASLPFLLYFELFGSSAGGAPHMGLQVVHDGVLDDWLRVRHVVMEISEQNPTVRFVKIDKCLFELRNGTGVPRDGLESWFESKVRVGLGQYDF